MLGIFLLKHAQLCVAQSLAILMY